MVDTEDVVVYKTVEASAGLVDSVTYRLRWSPPEDQ